MAEYNRGDVISTNCDACLTIKNKAVVASYICKDCKDFLCDECYTHHRGTLITRRHVLVRLERPANPSDVKGKQAFNQDDQPSTTSGSKNEGQTRKAKVKPFFAEYERVGRETKIVGSSDADLEEYKDGTRQRHGVKQAEVSGRKVKYDQNVRGRYGDKDQTVTNRMKNMRLDVGTSNTQTTRQRVKPYTTITLKHSLNVRRENDKRSCWITGLAVLQDKLIVCDHYNSKLKVYDSSYRFLYEYKCDYEPGDIDMLDVNTVVVSSWSGCYMRLLSVGNDSMKEISKINTEYGCRGVCCYGGKIYCVVGDSGVRVYTPDGELEHTFSRLSDGKVECNALRYITVNPQTGTLYVTDRYKGVLVLSTSGDVIAIMPTPQLENPQGIAVDHHHYIYVCGYGSNNVIQMSLDGGHVMEILSGEDKCKWPLCVKIYGNKMFVAHCDHKSYNGKVSIYQLS